MAIAVSELAIPFPEFNGVFTLITPAFRAAGAPLAAISLARWVSTIGPSMAPSAGDMSEFRKTIFPILIRMRLIFSFFLTAWFPARLFS